MHNPKLSNEKSNLLDESTINEGLKQLPNWERNDKEINREIVAEDFKAAIGVVNSIAVVAEILDHHPDILVYGWNKIRVTVSTHDKGGLTELDFKLAREIEKQNF